MATKTDAAAKAAADMPAAASSTDVDHYDADSEDDGEPPACGCSDRSHRAILSRVLDRLDKHIFPYDTPHRKDALPHNVCTRLMAELPALAPHWPHNQLSTIRAIKAMHRSRTLEQSRREFTAALQEAENPSQPTRLGGFSKTDEISFRIHTSPCSRLRMRTPSPNRRPMPSLFGFNQHGVASTPGAGPGFPNAFGSNTRSFALPNLASGIQSLDKAKDKQEQQDPDSSLDEDAAAAPSASDSPFLVGGLAATRGERPSSLFGATLPAMGHSSAASPATNNDAGNILSNPDLNATRNSKQYQRHDSTQTLSEAVLVKGNKWRPFFNTHSIQKPSSMLSRLCDAADEVDSTVDALAESSAGPSDSRPVDVFSSPNPSTIPSTHINPANNTSRARPLNNPLIHRYMRGSESPSVNRFRPIIDSPRNPFHLSALSGNLLTPRRLFMQQSARADGSSGSASNAALTSSNFAINSANGHDLVLRSLPASGPSYNPPERPLAGPIHSLPNDGVMLRQPSVSICRLKIDQPGSSDVITPVKQIRTLKQPLHLQVEHVADAASLPLSSPVQSVREPPEQESTQQPDDNDKDGSGQDDLRVDLVPGSSVDLVSASTVEREVVASAAELTVVASTVEKTDTAAISDATTIKITNRRQRKSRATKKTVASSSSSLSRSILSRSRRTRVAPATNEDGNEEDGASHVDDAGAMSRSVLDSDTTISPPSSSSSRADLPQPLMLTDAVHKLQQRGKKRPPVSTSCTSSSAVVSADDGMTADDVDSEDQGTTESKNAIILERVQRRLSRRRHPARKSTRKGDHPLDGAKLDTNQDHCVNRDGERAPAVRGRSGRRVVTFDLHSDHADDHVGDESDMPAGRVRASRPRRQRMRQHQNRSVGVGHVDVDAMLASGTMDPAATESVRGSASTTYRSRRAQVQSDGATPEKRTRRSKRSLKSTRAAGTASDGNMDSDATQTDLVDAPKSRIHVNPVDGVDGLQVKNVQQDQTPTSSDATLSSPLSPKPRRSARLAQHH